MNIAVIGRGSVGSRIGALIHNAGHSIAYGVQDEAAVDSMGTVKVRSISDAIQAAEIVIFAVPFAAYETLLPQYQQNLIGKIVVDVSNPINSDWSPLILGAETSAGETVAASLPDSQVVKAFNTVFADIMTDAGLLRDGHKVTTFIAGNDANARESISQLANDMGFSPIVAGDIRNARYLEAMAHLNIQLAVGQGGGTNAAFVYMRA